jgi:formylglycine-generating enzyme required for sulfatase activity
LFAISQLRDSMADVFISYRNTPDRRAIVRRLATILRAYEVTVWWDYGLEAGESFRAQITTELANARVVAPLWCVESVQSRWVRMEAEFGKDKLVPARLQKVAPPDAFEAIQAADLIGWDGAVGSPRLQAFVRRICARLGRPSVAPTDMIEELASLPVVPPLPEIVPAAAAPSASAATPAHDYAFWERQWEKQGAGTNLVALRAIAEEAPRYFADQARARIAEIEAAERRDAEAARKAEAAVARYRAEGRIKVDARIVHGPPDGWFNPGAGKSEWFKDIDIGPEMVVVPAGSFTMGSPESEPKRESWQKGTESPQREVAIAQPLAVGRHAVTRGQFAAFVDATGHKAEGAYIWKGGKYEHDPKGSWRNPGFLQDDNHPVVCINWDDAKAYAAWLTQATGRPYRLLLEAEWEYCCRAGTTTPFWWGSSITPAQANYDGNHVYEGGGSKGEYRKTTVPVVSFAANPWGLYQVHGNVWEWCEDDWHENYNGAPRDGSVWAGGDASYRVLRGGSWVSLPQNLRSANRNSYQPDVRSLSVGFRLARTLTS